MPAVERRHVTVEEPVNSAADAVSPGQRIPRAVQHGGIREPLRIVDRVPIAVEALWIAQAAEDGIRRYEPAEGGVVVPLMVPVQTDGLGPLPRVLDVRIRAARRVLHAERLVVRREDDVDVVAGLLRDEARVPEVVLVEVRR